MPCPRWFLWKLSNISNSKVVNFLNHKPSCYRTQITGITVISDASGFGFKQARHFTLDIARAGTAFVQVSLQTILKHHLDLIQLICRTVFPYGIDKSMLSMLQGYFTSFTTWWNQWWMKESEIASYSMILWKVFINMCQKKSFRKSTMVVVGPTIIMLLLKRFWNPFQSLKKKPNLLKPINWSFRSKPIVFLSFTLYINDTCERLRDK